MHDGSHGPDCFGCKVKSITLDSMGNCPSRSIDRKYIPRPIKQPSWEAGVAGEHRVDGSFMPYLDISRTGSEIGVKAAGERRHELEAERRSQITNPNHYGQRATA